MDSTPATHAIVIGTSKYKHLPDKPQRIAGRETFLLPQVQSPAIGAYLFAKWLKEEYNCPTAPIQSIALLASAAEQEIALYPELKNATLSNTANVRRALLSWWKLCNSHPDNVAILYLSGHGVQINKDQYYVLLEDFADDELTLSFAVDVKAVFDGMVGQSMARKQFYFVDACRARVTKSVDQWYGPGLGLPRLYNGDDVRTAPIILSAAPGTLALAKDGEAPLFSKALLECLNSPETLVASQGEVKTISYYSLIDALQTRLEKLCAEYLQDQYLVLTGQARNTTFQVKSESRASNKPEVEINSIPITATLPTLETSAFKLGNTRRGLRLKKDRTNRGDSGGAIKDGLRIVQCSEFLEYRVSERLVREFGDKLDPQIDLKEDSRFRGGWWWWSLSIDGTPDALDEIQEVDYKLHKSFGDNPYKRTATKHRSSNFAIEMVGWGGFDLTATIRYKDPSKGALTLRHTLSLFFPDGQECED